MSVAKKTSRILWYQTFAFLLIIGLSWMDELASLPHRFFGVVQNPDWHESAMESIAALLVWLPLLIITRKILKRLYYLEEFIRVCAWCRKIGQGDEWMPVEEYFSSKFNIETSHGMCPECAKQQGRESAK